MRKLKNTSPGRCAFRGVPLLLILLNIPLILGVQYWAQINPQNRDNYTCCNCGNSTYLEPNLLLEIDHIIPVSKGGLTVVDNLQTLCWKCNRAKSDKIVS